MLLWLWDDFMKDVLKITLYGAPRILGLLFIYLLSKPVLNALAAYPTWNVFISLLVQLRWSIFLAIILAFAWRWEWIGTFGFGIYAVWYMVSVGGPDVGAFLTMAGVPALIAVLFFIGFTFKKDILE